MTSLRIAGGAPIIKGTRIAVRAIAGYYQLGMSTDEILQSLPHMTQSQVRAALAFYFDHQEAIDRDLSRNSDADYWRKQVKQSPSVAARAAWSIQPVRTKGGFLMLPVKLDRRTVAAAIRADRDSR